jgi:uncharacterized protein GlcG (DUF336 family)
MACPSFADCSALPSQGTLQAALENAVAQSNGGLGFNMWATLVANDGTVCAVAFSGNKYTDQWLGSRVVSAQRANTANDFSLGTDASMPSGSVAPHGLALSTANLYSSDQPGGTHYHGQHSNPIDPGVAYQGNAALYGTAQDPLVGQRVGGLVKTGGGLALFASGGKKVGGLGVDGDTTCTDHFVAWRVRSTGQGLGLDHFGPPGAGVRGVSGDPNRPDNIVFDFAPTANGGILNPNQNTDANSGMTVSSKGGFGHPKCDAGNGTLNPLLLPAVQHN